MVDMPRLLVALVDMPRLLVALVDMPRPLDTLHMVAADSVPISSCSSVSFFFPRGAGLGFSNVTHLQ